VGNSEQKSGPDPGATTHSTTAVAETRDRFELALEGARPNPAHGGSMNVWFTLASREAATLELIDIAGRRVARRQVGALGPGPHLVTLGPSLRLKSGLYFLRLVQGERALTTRVVSML
jgi:hypothetical protein